MSRQMGIRGEAHALTCISGDHISHAGYWSIPRRYTIFIGTYIISIGILPI